MTTSWNASEDRNVSQSASNVDKRDEYLAHWEVVTLAAIFSVTLIGNIFVLLALYLRKYRERKKLTRMYFFILHLSVADLLTALLSVLPQLFWDITFRFQGGPVLCKIVKFGQPFGPYLSSYVLTVTALDRHQAICYPLNYCSKTSRLSRIMVYCAWTLTFILCTPQFFVFSYEELMPNVWDCWATFHMAYGERAYVTWYSISVFILPLCVLIYTYTGICIGLWSNSGIVGESNRARGQNPNPVISRAKLNTIKQTIAVITLYAASSSPFIGCQLWATWDPYAPSTPFFTGPTFTILALLSSLNSCVNPWIYLSFNRELRQTLVKYFCRSIERNYHPSFDKDARSRSFSRSLSRSFSRSGTSRMSHYANTIMRKSSSKEECGRSSTEYRAA